MSSGYRPGLLPSWTGITLAIFAAVVFFVILGSIEAGSTLKYTCVLCRLDRVDTTLFGLNRSAYRPNKCSRWYWKHVEPSHVHVWERGTCRTLLNALALPMGVGCRPECCAIWQVPPSTQMEVYRHFSDRQRAKELFLSLTAARSGNDRLASDSQSKGTLIARSIIEWEMAGFAGTWDEWWKRWWENYIVELRDGDDEHQKAKS
jgi:hypothetical protein